MSHKRLKTPNSCYHIFNRGIDGRPMFLDDEDRFYFHKILESLILEKKLNFICHAYAEMDNHFHLLLETINEDISTVIYFLSFKYARYYNDKYQRKGHLFQDSFESRLIFNNEHFKVTQAYIHNNWKEVCKLEKMNNMLYCSYQCFVKQKTLFSYLDIKKSLRLYHNDEKNPIEEFQRYTRNKFNKKYYVKYKFSDILFLVIKVTEKILEKRWVVITYLLKKNTSASYKDIFEILYLEGLEPIGNQNSYRRKYLRKIKDYPSENLNKVSKRLSLMSQLGARLY